MLTSCQIISDLIKTMNIGWHLINRKNFVLADGIVNLIIFGVQDIRSCFWRRPERTNLKQSDSKFSTKQ